MDCFEFWYECSNISYLDFAIRNKEYDVNFFIDTVTDYEKKYIYILILNNFEISKPSILLTNGYDKTQILVV